MKLLEVYLFNLMGFYGRNQIRCDGQNQLTVIQASRGLGKTTIVNAVYWCLYGKFFPGFYCFNDMEPSEILSKKAIVENANSYEVKVTMQIEETVYFFCRCLNSDKKPRFKITRCENGNDEELVAHFPDQIRILTSRPDLFVYLSIIHSDVQDYFFKQDFRGIFCEQKVSANRQGFEEQLRENLKFISPHFRRTYAEMAFEDIINSGKLASSKSELMRSLSQEEKTVLYVAILVAYRRLLNEKSPLIIDDYLSICNNNTAYACLDFLKSTGDQIIFLANEWLIRNLDLKPTHYIEMENNEFSTFKVVSV
jgi:hypothetical protein